MLGSVPLRFTSKFSQAFISPLLGRYIARVYMNIKEYIDRFSEISHMKREQQFVLLEQARDEIQLNTKWRSFNVIEFIVRTSFITLLAGGSYIIWGLSGWILFLAVLMGLVFSRVVIKEINDALILKGLKSILHKSAKCKP